MVVDAGAGHDFRLAAADHGCARTVERGRCLHAKLANWGRAVPVHLHDPMPHCARDTDPNEPEGRTHRKLISQLATRLGVSNRAEHLN